MDEDVLAYIAAVPDARRERVEALHGLIINLFPKVTVDLRYKMPTYTVGEGWVAVANQKQYVSLYTCSPEHIETFKQQYPDIKTGKGCINFRDRDDIPLAVLEGVVQHAISKPKGR